MSKSRYPTRRMFEEAFFFTRAAVRSAKWCRVITREELPLTMNVIYKISSFQGSDQAHIYLIVGAESLSLKYQEIDSQYRKQEHFRWCAGGTR